ncbi:MAG: 16S rRNA (guanine(527)-N(7))-methyltransferase RsmG [Oscillospiraceae bacterium]|nr:16S rRNA (guanine(527)-N(7))-methyltransferase RsmG [Oscillospiraceae bacterium]
MIDEQKLRRSAALYHVQLDDKMLGQFSLYAGLLLEWNKRMNLTSITDPDEIVVKHFVDSLILLPHIKESGAHIIDVGTGAGLPGIPLKIACPGLEMTLLDSQRKRVGFLEMVSRALGLSMDCVHGRAEDVARDGAYREVFDYALARAVAPLPVLSEYCLPFVRVNGFFMACKGPDVKEELEGASSAFRKLGSQLLSLDHLTLPNDHSRSLVLIKKISRISTKYPRKPAQIIKTPL